MWYKFARSIAKPVVFLYISFGKFLLLGFIILYFQGPGSNSWLLQITKQDQFGIGLLLYLVGALTFMTFGHLGSIYYDIDIIKWFFPKRSRKI